MSDRADRLSQRRKKRSQDQETDQEKPEQPAEQEQPEEPEEPEQQEKQSIKDQYQGTYIYLPEDLRQEFDLVADEMDTARRRRAGKHVEKIRHFEPLVVTLGLEKIEEMDDDELEDRLAEFDA